MNKIKLSVILLSLLAAFQGFSQEQDSQDSKQTTDGKNCGAAISDVSGPKQLDSSPSDTTVKPAVKTK